MAIQNGSTVPSRDVINKDKLYQAAALLLEALEGPETREGTTRTPERIARDWGELFEGYNYDPKDVLNRTFMSEEYDEIAMVTTNFSSTCEHHLLPFHGTAWVGYIPGKAIVGLDKLVKLVWVYSKRLQNQERITKQVAKAIHDVLEPVGAMVVVKASHDCVSLRGTRAVSETVTSACFGAFKTSPASRAEFMALVSLSKPE